MKKYFNLIYKALKPLEVKEHSSRSVLLGRQTPSRLRAFLFSKDGIKN
jgi:hypothetical protein